MEYKGRKDLTQAESSRVTTALVSRGIDVSYIRVWYEPAELV